LDRYSGVDTGGLVEAFDRQGALERMCRGARTVGQCRDADLIERVDVTPHARGLDLGRPRLLAEMREVGAPHRGGEAIDVARLEAGSEGVELDRMGEPDAGYGLAELRLGHERILAGHGAHIDVEAAELRGEDRPARIAAPD